MQNKQENPTFHFLEINPDLSHPHISIKYSNLYSKIGVLSSWSQRETALPNDKLSHSKLRQMG